MAKQQRLWAQRVSPRRKHKFHTVWSFTRGRNHRWHPWRSFLGDKRTNKQTNRWTCVAWSPRFCGGALKGHSGADWPVFFSRSIKSLIFNIFTYKVWTLNFYRKCQKFEVSFWRWEIPDLRTLPVGLAPSARWRLRFRPHCYDTTTYPR